MSVASWQVMTLRIPQEKFLGNNTNKSRFIHFLRIELQNANIMSSQRICDADVDIVVTGINTAVDSQNNKVVNVSEDTDVLAILTARTPTDMEVLMLKPLASKSACILYSSESLGSKNVCMRDNILFLHPFTGCDTASAFHSRGKVQFCNIFV